MLCKKNLTLLAQIAFLAIVVVAGLWIGAWIIPSSHAADVLPAPLFQSPIGNPELNIVKTVDNNAPEPGDEIVYTLTYSTTNPGSQVFDARLYDFLPAGVQFMSANPPAAPVGGVLLFTDPSVGPTNEAATVRVRVLEGYAQLYNYALLTADFVPSVYTSLLTAVEPPSPWLDLTKIAPSAVLTGTELVYTIRCENPSNFAVSDVTVIDVLPVGVTFNSASPMPDDVTPPLLSWSLGDLAAGHNLEIVITTTSPTVAGTITNTAIADARERIMTQTLVTTEVITEGAILQLDKDGSATEIFLGDELVYTLRYENTGNQVATGVRLTDTLPADVTVTGIYTQPTLISSDPLVWDVGSVLPGDPAEEIVITVTVQGGARTLHNVADITAPNSFPGHAEYDVHARLVTLFLPIVTKDFQ